MTTSQLMFVVLIEYLRPHEDLEPMLEEHFDWLQEQYAAGRILVSGRQPRPVGGVVVLRAQSREELETLLETEPFRRSGVVSHRVVPFEQSPFPRRSADGNAFLARPSPR